MAKSFPVPMHIVADMKHAHGRANKLSTETLQGVTETRLISLTARALDPDRQLRTGADHNASCPTGFRRKVFRFTKNVAVAGVSIMRFGRADGAHPCGNLIMTGRAAGRLSQRRWFFRTIAGRSALEPCNLEQF